MRFAHYLGRACNYGEEREGGKRLGVVVTNALCALPGTRLHLRRGGEGEGDKGKRKGEGDKERGNGENEI